MNMFKNYWKTSWRNLTRHKLFSFINVLGLAIGIATFFLITLYVNNELSFDRFNTNADRMYRVNFLADINGGKIDEGVTMPPVAQTMKRDFPEVEDATRILPLGNAKIWVGDKTFKEDRFALVDPNFFSIFTLPMIEGSPTTALLQPNTVVLTRSAAQKYFGDTDPVGKTIALNSNTNIYKITGVIRDIPWNSHFHFDMLASMTGWRDATSGTWLGGGYHTYLLLRRGADLAQLRAGLPGMLEKYMGPQIQQAMGISLQQFVTKGNRLGFQLQPLTDIHLHSDTSNEFEPGGNATYLYIFGGVALFMLIVACINFINLATAGASKRAREVGVRKVVGSGRWQLIKQFLTESVMVALIAVLVAVGLMWLVLPSFNAISGAHLSFTIRPLLALVVLGVFVGIVAGIYPAFYLSAFKPVSVLKGNMTTQHGGISLRSGLVVFQFVVSVALIIGTIVVYRQMQYLRHKDLGFNKEQLLTIPNSTALGKNEQVFEQQMLQNPQIEGATMSDYKPVGPTDYNNSLAYPAGNDHLIVDGVEYHVDENYIPVMGMHLAAGRNFSPAFPTDSLAIILNQTAAKALGWNDQSAIGKTVIRQNSDRGNNVPYHVIGVVKNFNFKSLHESISPLYMTLEPGGSLVFRINTANTPQLLSAMKTQWDRFNSGEPFTYNFMDDLFNQTYATEAKTGIILNVFSLLIIFVACLGLFGLATFTAEQRTKEIGIRKVLGASVAQITEMLSRDFLRLVLVAVLIAFPLAWWGMDKWLQRFAYRTELSWWFFAVAGLAALLIALLTISFKAIRAARANPAGSLRTE